MIQEPSVSEADQRERDGERETGGGGSYLRPAGTFFTLINITILYKYILLSSRERKSLSLFLSLTLSLSLLHTLSSNTSSAQLVSH